MNKFIFTLSISALLCLPVMASGDDLESVLLKDGSTLYVDQKGEMKMVDNHGNKMSMRDGVAMDTADGRVIMMKNNALWERMRRGSLNPKLTP